MTIKRSTQEENKVDRRSHKENVDVKLLHSKKIMNIHIYVLEFNVLPRLQHIHFDQQSLEDFKKAICWFHLNDEFEHQ